LDNIKTNLNKIGCEIVDWIDLAQDMDQLSASSYELGNEYSGSIKFWDFLEWMARTQGLWFMDVDGYKCTAAVLNMLFQIQIYHYRYKYIFTPRRNVDSFG
jgi:hypothetical protein